MKTTPAAIAFMTAAICLFGVFGLRECPPFYRSPMQPCHAAEEPDDLMGDALSGRTDPAAAEAAKTAPQEQKVVIGGDSAPPAPKKTGKDGARKERAIYKNYNIGAVDSSLRTVPAAPTRFTIYEPVFVTYFDTYHYFNKGRKPGKIALRHDDGTVYGPWHTSGLKGQGGVQNATWVCRPNVEIKAGRYTVLDSDPDTWSFNSGSDGAGFTLIMGY